LKKIPIENDKKDKYNDGASNTSHNKMLIKIKSKFQSLWYSIGIFETYNPTNVRENEID